jgi:uncharacterized membrane protein YkvA (DUF1232 family)
MAEHRHDRWRARAARLRADVLAVWLALRDPRVPWYAKAVALCVVAYAVSPIDLVPDFIPVLGYADDLLLLPLGVVLVIRLVPADVMEEHRARAAHAMPRDRRLLVAGAGIVVLVWVAIVVVAALVWRRLG